MNPTVQEQLEPEQTGLATVVQELKTRKSALGKGTTISPSIGQHTKGERVLREQYRELDE